MEENYNYEKNTILVVDDEPKIVDLLVHNLKREGYNTIQANDGATAVDIAKENRPDLILMDIMLPRLDGLSACKKIKNIYNVPILMVTARDDELDKIVGLELGADDYITKPFSIREVIARVKANLRKNEVHNTENTKKIVPAIQENEDKKENIIKTKNMIIDLVKYEVHVDGKLKEVSKKEFEVLKFLAQQAGQVVTRETLLEKVWGYEYIGDIRTVDVIVSRIRKAIEKDTKNPQILVTKSGIGYYIPNE